MRDRDELWRAEVGLLWVVALVAVWRVSLGGWPW